MFEFPWTRKRREAEKAEADRLAKLEREKQERRAAQVLSDQIHRSQLDAKFRHQRAQVTPIKPVTGLTAQAAAHDDKRKREDDDRKTSSPDDSWINSQMAVSFLDSSSYSSDSSSSCSSDSGSSDSGSSGSCD